MFPSKGTSLIFFALLLAGCDLVPRSPEVQVTDAKGKPLNDVSIVYAWSRGGDPWTGRGRKRFEKPAFTGPDGRATLRVTALDDFVSVEVRMAGFYPARFAYRFSEWKEQVPVISLNPVVAPEPMLGKQAFVMLPSREGCASYDFVKGDLVAPHGRGEVADCVFRWRMPDQRQPQLIFDSFDVEFPGAGNGVLAWPVITNDRGPSSQFHTLYRAPESGYTAGLRESARATGKEPQSTFVYYFKIRAGMPGGARYGKIVAGPSYRAYEGESRVELTYMLNPAGGTNMEPDIQKSPHPPLGRLEYPLKSSTDLSNR